jgi:hypothetical protein
LLGNLSEDLIRTALRLSEVAAGYHLAAANLRFRVARGLSLR